MCIISVSLSEVVRLKENEKNTDKLESYFLSGKNRKGAVIKTLLIFIIYFFLMACESKPGKSSQDTGSITAPPPPLSPPVVLSIDTEVLQDITAANAAHFRVTGSCLFEGGPVTVVVGQGEGALGPAMSNCTDGAWEFILDVTELNKTEGAIDITVDHSSSSSESYIQVKESVTNNFTCPENYVGVPSLAGYTTHSFCVMKHEAKHDGSVSKNIISQADSRPYVNIGRDDSINQCKSIGSGYDLITNDEWQTLARNIELVGDNWDTGVVGASGGLSAGHSDESPNHALQADSDDDKGCSGTGQICNGSTWHNQRRTHVLSNREIIWDMSGNVYEWVKDDSNVSYGSNAFMFQVTSDTHMVSNSLSGGTTTTSRTAKDQFGPSGDYTSLNTNPFGSIGYGYLDYVYGAISRGQSYGSTYFAGVFAVDLSRSSMAASVLVGFRCVHHP